MADPLHKQLLSQARRLAKLDPRKPQQANLRRAISSAYYALFHFLVDRACRELIGSTLDRKPFRDILARAFQHNEMANACKAFASGTLPPAIGRRLPINFSIPAELSAVASTFCLTQEKRHLADYDTAETFARLDAIDIVATVEKALTEFDLINSQNETRFFLLCILSWNRLSSRI